MFDLLVGQNINIKSDEIDIHVSSSSFISVYVLNLNTSRKIINNENSVIYLKYPKSLDNSIIFQEGSCSSISLFLSKISSEVQKISILVSCLNNSKISKISNLFISIKSNEDFIRGVVNTHNREETSLILGEFYRYKDSWKFKFIDQGFKEGLKPLMEYFGVLFSSKYLLKDFENVSQSSKSSVNLSKVSLSKNNQIISLDKKEDYGKIRINLNWNQGDTYNSNSKVDLDLGAFVRMKDGSKYVIQALGNKFGSFNNLCYVQLMGDDRTGENQDGEWIHINGSHWNKIDEVLIYTFIYDGVARWNTTDASVNIYVPTQPIIETFLTEGDNQKTLCAIARIQNNNNFIKVERINRYFKSQKYLDEAFDWGFNWVVGKKD